jgi:H+/Cl- antiporter ClcA
MRFLAIVGLCVAATVIYGIVHDQVTARVCIEYFTVGHPPVFGTEDPTLLGIGWGIIATWWVGLILGIPLAFAARAGSRPERSVRSLIRPVVGLMIVAALCAIVAGVVGWVLAHEGIIFLANDLASEKIPRERHAAFLADGFAHTTSYAVGFVGGLVVIARVWRSRRRG